MSNGVMIVFSKTTNDTEVKFPNAAWCLSIFVSVLLDLLCCLIQRSSDEGERLR